ncbi:hypothetical protein [Pseudomonas sp. D2002]|uniref:hypothetical protein n=1 Tax=Pseudomonas sp. D2002 TaxID=2726980 RepID=UPI0015A0EA16|nr:hypothetical protein [Pseudomonas sp. D2002]NWA84304.1 hypothetical protein [Pseudomonas sp. D2002]
MAWRQQYADCAWVAAEAPYVFANEYTANFISGFRTVLIAKVEGEGVGNQPFGKFFNDADGVELWNVALENAQNRGPQVDQRRELARINKSLRTANVVQNMP